MSNTLTEHPILSVLGLLAAAVGGTTYYLFQLHDKEVDIIEKQYQQQLKEQEYNFTRKVDDFEARLRSIDRGIGKEGFIDVQKLLIPKAYQTVPTNSAYNERGFYAATAIPGFKYSRTSLSDMYETQYGEKPAPNVKALPIEGLLHLGPVYLWESEVVFHIKAKHLDTKLHPFIALQKTPLRKLQVALGRMGLQMAQYSEADQTLKCDEGVEEEKERGERLKTLQGMDDKGFQEILEEKVFSQGIVGPYHAFTGCMNLVGWFLYPDLTWELIKAQKIDDVLYSQHRTTIRDATVNGAQRSTFFITHEVIMVSTRLHLYYIEITSPSNEPVDATFQSTVQAWLDGLKLIRD